MLKRKLLVLVLSLSSTFIAAPAGAATNASLPVPQPADARVAAVEVRVTPDHADWTYQPREQARFRLEVIADQHPVEGARVTYRVGPEMMPAEERTAVVPAGGLEIDGGTLTVPGFIRCSATVEVGGREYRGIATAAFAPGKIQPTQVEPEDFNAFWEEGLQALAEIPLEPKLTLIPEASAGSINVYHVSFRTWSGNGRARVFGILCEPKAPGKYPAILRVPGAGVRPYRGQQALAEAGAITLEIGIHGIPVNQPQEIYDELRATALGGYFLHQLDDRERYYYRRVYLGCVRANDFLTTRPNWDGRNLVVNGASQGGQLAFVTGALDRRVTAVSSVVPAYCDVTGYLHGRAGGWPHMMRGDDSGHRTPAKLATTSYYDSVNFAKRVRVPTQVVIGYNDETCPPTTNYAAYNVISAPKSLLVVLQMGHSVSDEANSAINAWVLQQAGVKTP